MKLLLKAAVIALLTTCVIVSCTKKTTVIPYIQYRADSTAFITNGITNFNMIPVSQDTQIFFGIKAYKGSVDDVLTKFYINVAYDDSSVYHQLFTEDIQNYKDTFKKIYSIYTRKRNGKERYNFVVENKEGGKNSLTLTLDVYNP
ncbi:MAG: hypothetical protein BGO69_18725 [Bacteroidetes bacterium 46-16]|nr:MAG: hypothetical protein BGO69_18725 [Bacteroidetes bacterium 46-16]